jgi:hypothetical protein
MAFMGLTDLRQGQVLVGPLFNEPMRVETVTANGAGSWSAGLVGQSSEQFRKVTLTARRFGSWLCRNARGEATQGRRSWRGALIFRIDTRPSSL